MTVLPSEATWNNSVCHPWSLCRAISFGRVIWNGHILHSQRVLYAVLPRCGCTSRQLHAVLLRAVFYARCNGLAGTTRLQLEHKGDTNNAYSNLANVVVAFAFVTIPMIGWLLDRKASTQAARNNCMHPGSLKRNLLVARRHRIEWQVWLPRRGMV